MSGSIIPPNLVTSPLDRLTPGTLTIVYSFQWWSLATGVWDGNQALLIRWNGDQDHPKGNPVSRGYPTWFVLPKELHECALRQVPDADASNTAREFLGLHS